MKKNIAVAPFKNGETLASFSVFSIWLLILLFCFASHGNAQIITTVAGNGTSGFSGDGIAATAAQLNLPGSIAIDNHGNLFISDANNQRIRQVDAAGVIHTIAGTGTPGYTGDGIPATAAELQGPGGLMIDTAGNLVVADFQNGRVRKINSLGVISTVAGIGSGFYGSDGIPATAASVTPSDVAVDSSNNLYIADMYDHRVFKVVAGIISTVAGTRVAGYSGDGLSATLAKLNYPSGIALDKQGNLFIADWQSNTVREVNTHGIISTVAGIGIAGFSGDGFPATTAKLAQPYFVAVDGCGNLYISDLNNARVRKVDPSGIISTIAGTGGGGYSGDDGPATAAQISSPQGIKVDSLMNVYVVDELNNAVRRISTANHPPAFTGGNTHSLTICEDTLSVDINAMLTVTDADSLQTETWSVIKGPAHGTVAAAFSATSMGIPVTPSGLSYTHTTGYTGADTFKVRVSDCGNAADTVTFYVQIINCELSVANSAGQSSLQVIPNPNDGTFTVSLPASVTGVAHLAVTNLLGQKITELDTFTNSVSNIKLNVPAGIYLLTASTKDGTYNTKVIVNTQ